MSSLLQYKIWVVQQTIPITLSNARMSDMLGKLLLRMTWCVTKIRKMIFVIMQPFHQDT
jgi:hypothetical protein